MSNAPSVQTQSHCVPSMLQAVTRILSPSSFPYGSNWDLFREAHFGRDALEVAEDLLAYRPAIARAVIMRLAALQGTAVSYKTEEEPGKIHHEHRALEIDGRVISEGSRRIFRQLAEGWALASTPEELDALTEMTYYGTVDATPLYVRLVRAYCELFGEDILEQEYVPRRWDSTSTLPLIKDSVRRAVDWIVGRLQTSDLGLLEFQRMTPRGHRFQAWKDGYISYLHPDGSVANCDAPIASIEVQGLAFDALTAALAILPSSAADRERWTAVRQRLQRATMEHFWMPEERYFALAIDRDRGTGEARQVRLLTSNPGALLDSGIFDALDADERWLYVSSIVGWIYSDQFLTPVGVRCNGLVHADIPGYAAYQSSYTVWHKETYDIAKGLRRQGFPRLADDLENRLLNAVNITGGAREFLYVMPDNRVDYRPSGHRIEGADEIVGTNVPENDQAWSISAALAIKYRHGNSHSPRRATGPREAELEARKLREFPPVHLLRTCQEVESACPPHRFWINADAAIRREAPYTATHAR